MHTPSVSVLLPVFNAAKFLRKSIESLLNQTFTDFELVVINDGSFDDSEHIIHSFKDSRIVYLKNSENKGLVFSLNKGIEACRGRYIARMDADDIAINKRLELQKQFLDINRTFGLVATSIRFINEQDQVKGYWSIDQQNVTSKQIRIAMLKESCIAHPSIMGRAEIIKKYQYREYQKNIEDYDLWLRMLNDKIEIGKISESLLLYRIHDSSITKKDLIQRNVFYKLALCKLRFVYNECIVGKLSPFVFTVFIFSLVDLIKAMGKEIKKVLGFRSPKV